MSNIKKAQEQVITATAGSPVKINPFSLKRPPTVIKTFTFEDSNLPADQPFVITLKKIDASEAMAASEVATVYCDRYLGSQDSNGEITGPKQPFPIVDDLPVTLSRDLIIGSVFLWMMSQNLNELGEKMYTVDDFIAMSVTIPEAWNQLGTAMAEVQGSGQKNLKAATGQK